MIDLVKRWILYKIKSFQFRIRTLQNAFEISKAYSSNRVSRRFHYRKLFTTAVLFIVGSAVVIGIGFGIVMILRSNLIKNIYAAIPVRDEKKVSSGSMEFQKKSIDIEKMIKREVAKVDSTRLIHQIQSGTAIENSQIEDSATTVPELKIPTVDPSLYVYDSGAQPVSDDSTDYMVIVANKASHTLFLLQRAKKNNWKTVRTYFVAIGAQQGQKITAGDKRTPEGLYIIVDRKEQYQLSSIYGPLAFVLDYPNEEDRIAGRTGQGIWIHGTEKDTVPFETKGCLEIKNSDLIQLSDLLKSGKGTPVYIVNDSLLKNPSKVIDTALITRRRQEFFDSIKMASSEFLKFVTDWQYAWESKNVDRYSSYYFLSKFSAQGMNWDGWKEKKIKTFQLYDTINVTYSKLTASDLTDSSAVLRFSQVYQTEKVRFQNNKQLNLEKEQGMWKITREAAF
jgi:hypothetical protein